MATADRRGFLGAAAGIAVVGGAVAKGAASERLRVGIMGRREERRR